MWTAYQHLHKASRRHTRIHFGAVSRFVGGEPSRRCQRLVALISLARLVSRSRHRNNRRRALLEMVRLSMFGDVCRRLLVFRQASLVDEAAKNDVKATVDYSKLEESGAGGGCELAIGKLAENEALIEALLRQIMMSVDLDEVTSRSVRDRLAAECAPLELSSYKDFIDRQMLLILGQLERPSKILSYLYLGTEWNAANFDELLSLK